MIDIEVEDRAWLADLPAAEALARAAAQAALEARPAVSPQASLTILLTDDESVRELNQRFRNRPSATNVLSFPALANPEHFLGDVALAHGVCVREAAEQGKTLSDHMQHLVAHGALHLLGCDHAADAEAEEMEDLERAVLAGLGIGDPYAPAKGTDD